MALNVPHAIVLFIPHFFNLDPVLDNLPQGKNLVTRIGQTLKI